MLKKIILATIVFVLGMNTSYWLDSGLCERDYGWIKSWIPTTQNNTNCKRIYSVYYSLKSKQFDQKLSEREECELFFYEQAYSKYGYECEDETTDATSSSSSSSSTSTSGWDTSSSTSTSSSSSSSTSSSTSWSTSGSTSGGTSTSTSGSTSTSTSSSSSSSTSSSTSWSTSGSTSSSTSGSSSTSSSSTSSSWWSTEPITKEVQASYASNLSQSQKEEINRLSQEKYGTNTFDESGNLIDGAPGADGLDGPVTQAMKSMSDQNQTNDTTDTTTSWTAPTRTANNKTIKDALIGLSESSSVNVKDNDGVWFLAGIIRWVKDTLMSLVAVIAIWAFLFVWIRLWLARWNPEEFKKAMTQMIYVVVWIFIVSIAWAIVTLVAGLTF